MLKQRILTAIILIPIMLGIIIYLPMTAFLIFTTLFTLAAAWEWSKLMQLTSNKARALYVGIMLLCLIAALFIPIFGMLIVSAVWWVIALLLLVSYSNNIRFWNRSTIVRGIMGVLVLVPCWAAINFIRNDRDGLYALLYLLALIWIADSVAYFIGRKWGTTKLAESISPKKSVQGVVAALISTVIISMAASWFSQNAAAVWIWGILLSLITVIFSIIGDLFESMLKREADLKDSGAILPGHGGILDRIDSLTAAAPIFVLGAILLGMYLN